MSKPGIAVGTVDDVRDARRALVARVAPAWRATITQVGFALALSGSLLFTTAALRGIGSGTTVEPGGQRWALVSLGLGVLVAVVGMVVSFCHRNPPFRPKRLPLFARRITVWQAVATGSAWVLILGLAALSGTTGLWPGWFVIAAVGLNAVMISAMYALGWRLDPTGVDSSPLCEYPHRPATLDPLIAPRERLAVCAALAGAGQIGDDLLARTLGISTYEVSRVTADLVRAQYIYVQPDGPRWWLGLTPHGRAAYRRHLRALLEGGA
ncbi:MAG: MarR family winged helix-turn-helix transcriptional regulator [Mycolicibacterium insubricum]|nr:winged helix-turn-helix transcriptional regulator [Mycobacterium sp.]